ncbi:BA75_00585T0 [Komagataella pastoris]|uniref:BA75_00585T0 n=1 Tax=Komagataella pastoris TaxID=4922 RepID=A0A1B2J6K9_PICPA|nr:BA75_00585T0 [Komagataella pastoris]
MRDANLNAFSVFLDLTRHKLQKEQTSEEEQSTDKKKLTRLETKDKSVLKGKPKVKQTQKSRVKSVVSKKTIDVLELVGVKYNTTSNKFELNTVPEYFVKNIKFILLIHAFNELCTKSSTLLDVIPVLKRINKVLRNTTFVDLKGNCKGNTNCRMFTHYFEALNKTLVAISAHTCTDRHQIFQLAINIYLHLVQVMATKLFCTQQTRPIDKLLAHIAQPVVESVIMDRPLPQSAPTPLPTYLELLKTQKLPTTRYKLSEVAQKDALYDLAHYFLTVLQLIIENSKDAFTLTDITHRKLLLAAIIHCSEPGLARIYRKIQW